MLNWKESLTALAVGTFIIFGCVSKKESKEEREFDEDGIEQAMHQEWIMTHDPSTNTIPRERLIQARAQMLAQQASNNRYAGTDRIAALTWQERGPNNIGGRTRAIVVDRRDASGNTVLAASVSGGIFRTTTFLTAPNWVPVADNIQNLAVTAMIQDRSNGNVFYAGTGEGWLNVDAVKGAGIFKSTDGGLTWSQMTSTAGFEYVQDLEQDNNGNLYASLRNLNTANRGVMRSTDAGASWTQVLGAPLAGFVTGRAADLEVASNGDVYATLGIFTRSVVMKSAATNGSNTGAVGTWVEITPVHTAITTRAELAIAPSNPQRLYLAMVDSATDKVNYVYRSFNAGVTWDSLPAPDNIVNNGSVSQAWYNLILAVSPTNPDFVTLGAFNVARSSDAGANWTNITSASGVHVDQHVLKFVGSSSNLIVGNDGGVWYSVNADAASPTFANKNSGFNVTQFYGTDFHPTQADYFLAGAQDNNTQKFSQPNLNSTIPVVGGDGGIPHIRQTDGILQIAATTKNNYYRSLNSGATFSYLSTVSNSRGQFINATDLDNLQNILYCGDDAGKYYFISGLDATPSGSQVPLSALGTNRIVTAVKVDPVTPNTIWLGTSSDAVAVMPGVVKVSSSNTTTPSATFLALPSTAGASVSCVDVDPANTDHLLVTLSNYGVTTVFESINGGVSWNNIQGNLPDMPVRWGLFVPSSASVDGSHAGGILLATELGVWYTAQSSGISTVWAPQNTGFPNVRTDMLRYRASTRTLVAATHGRGLYTTTLTGLATGIPTVSNTRNFIDYVTNTSAQLFVKTGNLSTTSIEVQLFDAMGRLVYDKKTGYSNQSLPIGGLASGSYILKVYGNKNEQYTKQFVK